MIKLSPAEREAERLKPHLGMFFQESGIARLKAAAKMDKDDPAFREGTSYSLVRFLVASIAALHRVTLADQKLTQTDVKRRRAVTRKIAAICRLWEKKEELPDYLWRAFLISIWHEASAERALAKITGRKRGRPQFWAFGRLIEMLADNYRRATSRPAIVKFNNAPTKQKERYSGPFSELIEEAYSQVLAAWEASGFKVAQLPAPSNRDARLDYARKRQPKRVTALQK